MLTPSATDPNREQELVRKKLDPSSFGIDANQTIESLPRDWASPGNLRNIAKEIDKWGEKSSAGSPGIEIPSFQL